VASMTVGSSVGQMLGLLFAWPVQSSGNESSLIASACSLAATATLACALTTRVRAHFSEAQQRNGGLNSVLLTAGRPRSPERVPHGWI
jgi:hypothetical protein